MSSFRVSPIARQRRIPAVLLLDDGGPSRGVLNSAPFIFTGEEAPRTRCPCRPEPRTGPTRQYAPENLRQSGYAVVLDPSDGGDYTQVAGMGRHNHENAMVLPGGWDKIAVISGDDTFSAPSSQLYMYLADNEEVDLGRSGEPAGVPCDPTRTAFGLLLAIAFNGANDYGDVALGDHLSGPLHPGSGERSREGPPRGHRRRHSSAGPTATTSSSSSAWRTRPTTPTSSGRTR